MEEIAVLELKQKRLITMLSQIDPVIYLQKLQQELSALQVPETEMYNLNHLHFELSYILHCRNSAGDQQKTQTDQHCRETGTESERRKPDQQSQVILSNRCYKHLVN